MRSRWARITTVSAVAAALAAGAALGTGTAAGSAQPIIVGSCATTVQGAPGTPVELSPSAVLGSIDKAIDDVLGPLDILGSPLTSAVAALPNIPIGSLPTGKTTVTGAQIADDVMAQLDKLSLPVVGNLLTGNLLPSVLGEAKTLIASGCGLVLNGVNAAAAPVQQGASSIGQAAQSAEQQAGLAPKSGSTSGSGGGSPSKTGTGGSAPPAQQGGSGGLPASNSPVVGGLPPGLGSTDAFGPGALLDFGLADSPLARYAGIPFASAGLFDQAPGARYGGDVPGLNTGQLGQGDPADGVQTAGQAFAYNPGGGLGDGVGLPMLLAVLMLAGVTAALVRTWVLRRVRTA